MEIDVPGGTGPWFCCLLFNTALESKKKTHLIAHTLPHLALDVLNHDDRLYNAGTCNWIMILKVGPFAHWNATKCFLNLWTTTRGKKNRLERGLELYTSYRESYHLRIWTPPHTSSKRPYPDEDEEDESYVEKDLAKLPLDAMVGELTSIRELFAAPDCTVGAVKSIQEKLRCKAPKKSKRKK